MNLYLIFLTLGEPTAMNKDKKEAKIDELEQIQSKSS